MYLALIVLPLLGSIVSGFFGRKIGVQGSHIITCSCVIITTLLAVTTFFEVGMNNIPVSLELFRWVDSESLNILWAFNFDSLTVSMLIPVLIVSSLVHVYSISYMSHDPHNQRFFSYLSLFTFMMIMLVTANNFLLMFVGWEGVGICSYLLVSFWFTRIAANQSSLAAFLTNRVGDCLLTIGMFAILWTFGNIDYNTVFSIAPYINENIITIIGICLLIGAMAKSSQIGLHIWLPMAMEGPTPVSALIHAATMVTAGVYLLIRSSPLIEYSSTTLILCLWVGAVTTVFSSLIGLFQQDIKKVIAYSTMSQLGMMVIAVGLSSYNIALFHLVNHAFYKALLFLGAGSVIHAVADNQDFRRYGGLKQFLPLTYTVMLIASLSLVAFPFMTGFYSKDLILESAYGQYYLSGTVVYYLAVIGAMFTTLYSIKVLYLTFLTNPNGPVNSYKQAHEGDIYMSLPLIILALFSIFFGYMCKDLFIGLGSSFFMDNSIYIHPNNEILLNTEFAVPLLFKILPLIITLSLSLMSILITEYRPELVIAIKNTRIGYNMFSLLNQRFYIELLYNHYINSKVLMLGGQTTKILDKGSIELIGPYGLENGLLNISKNLNKLDTGVLTSYALYILIGLIFYLITPYIALHDYSVIILLIFGLFTLKNNNFSKKIYFNNDSKQSSLLFMPSFLKKMGFLFKVILHSNPLIKHLKYNISILKGKFMTLSLFKKLILISITWYLYIGLICGYIFNNSCYIDDIDVFKTIYNSDIISPYVYINIIIFKYSLVLSIYWSKYSIVKIIITSFIILFTLFTVILNTMSAREKNTSYLLFKLMGLILFVYNNPRCFLHILICNIVAIVIIRNLYCCIYPINFKEYVSIFSVIHFILSIQLIASILFSYISNNILCRYKIINSNKTTFDISNINITRLIMYTLFLYISTNFLSPFIKTLVINIILPYITQFFDNFFDFVKSFSSSNSGWPKNLKPKGPKWDDIEYKFKDEDDEDYYDLDHILDQYVYSYYDINNDYLYAHVEKQLISFPEDKNGNYSMNNNPLLKINPTIFIINGKPHNSIEMKNLVDHVNSLKTNISEYTTKTKPWEFKEKKQFIKDLDRTIHGWTEAVNLAAKYKFLGDKQWLDSVINEYHTKELESQGESYAKDAFASYKQTIHMLTLEYFVLSNAKKYYHASINNRPIDPKHKLCFEIWRLRQQGWLATHLNNTSPEGMVRGWEGPLMDFSNDKDVYNIIKEDYNEVAPMFLIVFTLYGAMCNAKLPVEDIDNLHNAYLTSVSYDFLNKAMSKFNNARIKHSFNEVDHLPKRFINGRFNRVKNSYEGLNESIFSNYQASKNVNKRSIFDCLEHLRVLKYRINSIGLNTAYKFGYNYKKVDFTSLKKIDFKHLK